MSRRGNILSVFPITKTVLRKMGLMSPVQTPNQTRPIKAEMQACYIKTESMLVEHGGEYWGETKQSGKKYKFPPLKDH